VIARAMVTSITLAGALALALACVLAAGCGGGSGDDVADDTGDDTGDDAPTSGPMTVTGAIEFEDRAPQVSGTLGPRTPAPARYVAVALIDAGGATVAETTTDATGAFELAAPADVTYGDAFHLLAATTSGDATRPVEVVRGDGNVHGFGGADFAAAAAVTADVLVTEESDAAGAFNIYDRLVEAVDRVTQLGETPTELVAIWQRGSFDGTYYNGQVHLLGGSDDDSYDDTVILHECGHWFEHTVGRSDNPGGAHSFGEPADPNTAWSEGFSTYWGTTVNGSSRYVDTMSGGGFSIDVEGPTTQAPGDNLGDDLPEDTVAEILWDLSDPAGEGAEDPFAGDADAVMRVQPDYLRTASLRAVGEPGVDLVDFLDGFFVADGLDRCAAVTAVVTTARGFPYDYAGPAGACP
jgi:hypothetical protein